MPDDQLPPDSLVLADKAYDAEWIRAMIEAQDAVPIIPNRSTAKTPYAFSPDLYRLRNRVERFFNKLKQFRRIATRYEKLAANYLTMIKSPLSASGCVPMSPRPNLVDLFVVPLAAVHRNPRPPPSRLWAPLSR